MIKTLRECDHILGLIAVLLRGVNLVSKCGCQSATRCSNSLHMYLGSSGVLRPLKMFMKICYHTCTKVIHIVFSTLEQGFETPPAECPPVECGQFDDATGALYRKDRSSQSDQTLVA